MPNVIPWIWFFRLGQLITAAIFAVVVLGLTADIINKVDPSGFGTPVYAGWTLTTSALSLCAITPVVVNDLFPKNGLLFLVGVEVTWCSTLTILWLVSAAATTSFLNRTSCISTISNTSGTILQPHSQRVRTCHEIQAVVIFGWVNFINLGAWLIILIGAVNRAHRNGRDSVGLEAVFEVLINNTEESSSAAQGRGDSVPMPQVQVSVSYPSNHGHDTKAPQIQA